MDAASPRGGSDYYYYYLVLLRKRGGPFPPHLFIGSRRKLRRDRGQKPGVRRCVRRDVDASRGNKEVKSAYRPPPQHPPPPKNENARGEKHRVASRTHQWGTRGCPAAGEAERTAGELLITRAIHRLSCSVSNQGGSWGFRGIKYGLRVNRRRRGLVALTGKKSVWGNSGPTERAGASGGSAEGMAS